MTAPNATTTNYKYGSATVRKSNPLRSTFTAIATTLLMALSSQAALAGSPQSFTDYAPVLRVVPVYKNITVREPQKICRPASRSDRHNYRQPNRQNGHHQNNQRHNRTQTRHRNSHGEVFVAGVIGGAIGRQLSRSVNGRPSTGATIAGAVIGSALASSASANTRHARNHKHQTNLAPIYDNRQYNNRQNRHQNGHHGNRQHHNRQHCTTTVQTRTERQHNGYNVTYRYRGQHYQTHTRNHPGDRIAISVTLNPLQ